VTSMRAPATDLPIVLQDVSYRVRDVAILDRVSVSLAPGAPTVLIGPNGGG
jgi:tungstate transport system ATP-binding protein